MAYTTINKSSDHFNTVLYTGNGATSTAGTLARTISGVGFQPDFTWLKERTAVSGGYTTHGLHDAVRGASKWIGSNSTNAETDATTGFGNGGLGSFTSDGFGIHSGTAGSTDNYNVNTGNYVSWNWKANGQGSSNSDGSITTTYTSANTTSGVSIIKYTGNKTSGATIGHGLSAVPKVIIGKRLDTAASWGIYHSALGATKYMAFDTSVAATSTAPWNDTEPTSSVITLGNWDNVNASSGSHVIYAFAEKTGFSKFGSYTGNGSTDGAFIYTGFKPAFVMIKGYETGGSDNWNIIDNKRTGYNASNYRLFSNSTASENTTSIADILSNGFKLRVSSTDVNALSKGYIFMAFAEAPLVGSNNIPCTAR